MITFQKVIVEMDVAKKNAAQFLNSEANLY